MKFENDISSLGVNLGIIRNPDFLIDYNDLKKKTQIFFFSYVLLNFT